jgi:hypothetical protein
MEGFLHRSDLIKKFCPVGSRITCEPVPENADHDYLCLANDKWRLIRCAEGAGYVYKDYYNDFISLKHSNCDLIVVDNEELYNKFVLATNVAKKLNLLKKSDRITLFDAVIYGK